MYTPIITHSFNIKDNRIVDFSRLDNNLNVIQYGYDYFPNTYVGFKIPQDFIDNYRTETLVEHSMNPLIIDYYIETQN